MVGIIIVTHGRLGSELLNTLEMIVGRPQENMIAIDILHADKRDNIKDKISKIMKKLDKGDGILILTDLFGGTACNIGLSFLHNNHVEVITGINLPMLIKLSTASHTGQLDSLKKILVDYGRHNIVLASEVLNKELESKCR